MAQDVETSGSSWSKWMGMIGTSPSTSPAPSPRHHPPRSESSKRILGLTPQGSPVKTEDENSMKNHLFYAVERGDLEMTWSVLSVHEVPTLQLLFAVSETPQFMTLYDKLLYNDGLQADTDIGSFWIERKRGRSDGLFTPLHIAARQGYADVASCLLHNLELFVGKGSADVLSTYCNKATCSEENITPLHLAVYAPIAADDHDANECCSPARARLQHHMAQHHITGDRLTCLREFLSHGADVNSKALVPGLPGPCTGTALHMACVNFCCPATLQLLLQHGADPNAELASPDKTLNRATPLHLAIRLGLQQQEPQCLQAVRLLTQHGADLFHTTCEGTALHVACKRGSGPLAAQLVELLVQLMHAAGRPAGTPGGGRAVGLGPTVPGWVAGSPSSRSSRSSSGAEASSPAAEAEPASPAQERAASVASTISLLSPSLSPSSSRSSSPEAAAAAAAAADSPPHPPAPWHPASLLSAGYTPLQRALANPAAGPELITALHSTSMPADTASTLHALIIALCTDGPLQAAKVSALLALGLQLETPCAVEGLPYEVNIFQWLLLAAAGMAPAAVSHAQLLAAVRQLLQLRGADQWPDVPVRAGRGRTGMVCVSAALFALRWLGSELLGEVLLGGADARDGCWVSEPSGRRLAHCALAAAVERRRLSVAEREVLLRVLLELGADVRGRSELLDGRTALHLLQEGEEQLVLLLARAGADVDATDSNGDTPLISACAHGHALVARMLLMQAAEADVRNRQRRNALHMVCIFDPCGTDSASLARSLLKAGVSPRAEDCHGCTPLDYARSSGNAELFSVVHRHHALALERQARDDALVSEAAAALGLPAHVAAAALGRASSTSVLLRTASGIADRRSSGGGSAPGTPTTGFASSQGAAAKQFVGGRFVGGCVVNDTGGMPQRHASEGAGGGSGVRLAGCIGGDSSGGGVVQRAGSGLGLPGKRLQQQQQQQQQQQVKGRSRFDVERLRLEELLGPRSLSAGV